MKITFTVALLVNSFLLFAQQQLAYFPVKKGIYTTFRDIRSNTPATDTGFTIMERASLRSGGGEYKLESDSLSGNGLREFKKQYVGFSDGTDFYISDRFTTGGLRGLTKCSLKGRYIIAEIEVSQPGTAAGAGGYFVTLTYVIDVSKGLSLKLTKKVIKDIVGPYADINEEYKDRDLIKHVQEVLQKVNQKQTVVSEEDHK